MSTEFDQFLSASGQPIGEGVHDRGLSRDHALIAIQLLREAGVGILGGDVYEESDKGIRPAYAMWGCERRAAESRSQFSERSCTESEDYIKRYPESRISELLFVLVKEE